MRNTRNIHTHNAVSSKPQQPRPGPVVGHAFLTNDADAKPIPGRRYQYFADGLFAHSVLRKKDVQSLKRIVAQGNALSTSYLYHFTDEWARELGRILDVEAVYANDPRELLMAALLQAGANNFLISCLLVSHSMNVFGTTTAEALTFGSERMTLGEFSPRYDTWKRVVEGTESAVTEARRDHLERLLAKKACTESRVKL